MMFYSAHRVWDMGSIRTVLLLLSVDTRLMVDEECESAWLSFLAANPDTIL